MNTPRTQTGALLTAGLIALAGATGCMSPSSSTKEHSNAAKERLDQVKSGQEYGMAQQAFLAGNLDKALDGVERSIALNPNVPTSLVLRGRIMLERGVFNEAIASFDRALAIDPQDTDAFYYKGIVYERLTEREVALECYMQAAAIDTDNAQFAIAVAEVMVDNGNTQAAYDFLTDHTERFEHNPGVRQTMGHLCMMLDDYTQAEEQFAQARLLAPDDNAILEDLARCQVYNGNFAEAEYNLTKLIDSAEPDDRRDLLHLRARCLVATDRPLEARTVLLELTGDNQGQADVDAWALLGQVAYKLKDIKNVRRAGARLIAIAPDRYEGHLYQALWQRSEGQFANAVKSTTEALERKPNDFTALVVRGLALYDMGKLDFAKKTFIYTQQLYPDNPTIERALAAIDRKMTDSDSAFAAVEEPAINE